VGTPDASAYWRLISQHKVDVLFTAPTAIRAIKREDPFGYSALPFLTSHNRDRLLGHIEQHPHLDQKRHHEVLKNLAHQVEKEKQGHRKGNLSSLKGIFLAGERADWDTVSWAQHIVGDETPVIDHWWQTETGWPMASRGLGYGVGVGSGRNAYLTNLRHPSLLPVKKSSVGLPVPGYDIYILGSDPLQPPKKNPPNLHEASPAPSPILIDTTGTPPEEKIIGEILVKAPLPPGTFSSLWRRHDAIESIYFSHPGGYYHTQDAGYLDEQGYVFVEARTDDVINTAGHRLSTSALEEVLATHPAVAECAVVGVDHELKGEVPLGVVVLRWGEKQSSRFQEECVALVRAKVGPVAAFKTVVEVSALPKTRSGKIVRKLLRQLAEQKPYTIPPTIENEAVVEDIKQTFALVLHHSKQK
jgi:propionyl-CoA synthetase